MDNKYQILATLWSLVKDIPQPAQYQCLPRQLILLSNLDWAMIYAHLVALENEGLVQIIQADNIQFSITHAGIEMASSLTSLPAVK